MSEDPLLVAIVGPTASGKTALSLFLAEQLSGEIINCDSVAMYREFEIGTAKPTPGERVRAPHHLLDCIDPTERMNAGEYARLARITLDDIHFRRHVPVVVGGTGLYLRALLDGLFPGPQRCDELRERLRECAAQKGSSHLHRVLCRLDPNAAAAIHPNDLPKIIRGIEICLTARQPMTEMWRQGRKALRGFRIARIGLNPDRAALYERIDDRAAKMFESGLIEETQQLIAKYGDSATPLQSLGYKQAAQLLRGEIDAPAAVLAAQQAHRNYAKRQMTWFRREPNVAWLAGFGDEPSVQRQALAAIRGDSR